MTQIPEAGSVWSRSGQDMCRVVYADDVTVLAEWLSAPGVRFTSNTDRFSILFQPETRKVTYRRWVNLYADGRVGDFHETERAALELAERLTNEGYVETRLIEWTVEE